MPSLAAHFDIAIKSDAEDHGFFIHESLGVFLFGSVTPDIRIINNWKRESTHFSNLDDRLIGQGAKNMEIQYPDLFKKAGSSPAKKAFLAGYINHLIADESWINVVYSPYFGNNSLFNTAEEANLYDRVLQLDLDRLSRVNLNNMEFVKENISNIDIDLAIDFLTESIVVQWRDWLLESTSWEFSWERIRRLARRQKSNNVEFIDQLAQSFLDDVPANLTKLYDKLPDDIIDNYLATVNQNYREARCRYLT